MTSAERERLYELAREAGPHMRTAWDDWLPRLDAQRAELGAAIASYIEEGDARGAEMAAAVSGFWWRSGHLDEGRALLSKVVASGLATRPEVRYPLLQGLGTTLFRQGDNDAAERIFEAALADAETLEPISRVSALCDLSRVALRRGNFGSVRDHAHRAYELSETIPGDDGKAARRIPAHMLAAAARMEGDYPEARRYYEESQELSYALGNPANAIAEHHNLGYVALHSGEIGDARKHFRRVLEWVVDSREMYLLPYCVVDSAVLALRDGELERAATLLAAAQAIFDSTGSVPDPDDRVEIDNCRAALNDRMDAAAYSDAEARGRALTVDDALELALAG